MSSEYIVRSAAYGGPRPVVSTRPDEYSVAPAQYDGLMSVYIGLRNRYDRSCSNYDRCWRSPERSAVAQTAMGTVLKKGQGVLF